MTIEDRIIVKPFNELTLSELYELLRLRSDVFVVEQNCAYQDLDGIDYDAVHIFALHEDGRCGACARVFRDASCHSLFRIGRLISKVRGHGLGMRMLLSAIGECTRLGANEIRLHAQQYAIGFYEKAGFSVCSDVFLEDGIPHVEMVMSLK
jgi:ElaA protein